jgi:hypothetical protein
VFPEGFKYFKNFEMLLKKKMPRFEVGLNKAAAKLII